MSEGLIGGLGVALEVELPEGADGALVYRADVLDLLRSDETREALVRASFKALGCADPDERPGWEVYLHRKMVDAIVRALAGDGAL